jgi:UDP:flavonoid glycosyltransferase YjiC (YdhE family)
MPEPLIRAMDERSDAQHARRSLALRPRSAYLDPFPDILRTPDETPEPDRITIRPATYAGDGTVPDLTGIDPARPTALLTLGTTVKDPAALATLAAAVARSEVNVLVTADRADLPERSDLKDVQTVGFVPLSHLLPITDVVVTAGGTGTLLSALGAGLPLVVRPFKADHPSNAARAGATGAAFVIEHLSDATDAVRTVLDEPAYRQAATKASAFIAAMNPPETALARLLARLAG